MTPGLFGGVTQFGLEEVSLEASTFDAELKLTAPAWQHMWRPEFDVTPAFNARSTVLPVMRVEGVSWGMLSPLAADSLIIGQGSAVTLDGRYDAALQGQPVAIRQLGQRRARASGGSRAAQYMLFDQAIREVRKPERPVPRRSCCPRDARRSSPISQAGASFFTSIGPRTSARSRASRRRAA